MTMKEVNQVRAALGKERHHVLYVECQREGRHGLAANREELAELPVLSDSPFGGWRYCPVCFIVFDDDGAEVEIIEMSD